MARMTKAAAEKLAREVFERYRQAADDMNHSGWVRDLERWDEQYRMKVPRQNKPWYHATEVNMPLTWSKVRDVHAVLHSFFKDFEFFSVAPAGVGKSDPEMVRDAAEKRTDMLKWSAQNESNLMAHFDGFIDDGLKFGCAFSHISWLQDIRSIMTELHIPESLREASKELSDKDLISAALGASRVVRAPVKTKGSSKDEPEYRLTFIDDDGEEKEGTARVDRDHPYRAEGDAMVLIERDSVYYDAPYPKLVSPAYMVVPPASPDLQNAEVFWMIEPMTMLDVRRLIESGVFNAVTADAEKELERWALLDSDAEQDEEDGLEAARDEMLSVKLLGSRRKHVKVIWEYRYEDPENRGVKRSMVRAVASLGKEVLLGDHRLEYLWPHGRRPFADWHFERVQGRYYGAGIPEILESLQFEENSYYQNRGDALEIITKPAAMYDPMSWLGPDTLRLAPGMLIKASNPNNALRELRFSSDPSWLWKEQSGIEMQAERAIGSTDMGLGRGPTRPNAPRTLGGTALVVRQQQVRTDVALWRLIFGSSGGASGGIREILMQYMELYMAFMPERKEIRMGDGSFVTVSRADLQGRFDFVIDVGPDVNNPQLRMSNAMVRYQNMVANPLVMQNPDALYFITIDFLRATGMKNATKVLPSPTGNQRPPMDQAEENEVLRRGVYVEALMSDQHDAHLAVIAAELQDQQSFAMKWSPDRVQLLERHAQEHMMFKQAQQAQNMMAGQLGQGAGMGGMSPLGMGPSQNSPMNAPGETFAGGDEM